MFRDNPNFALSSFSFCKQIFRDNLSVSLSSFSFRDRCFVMTLVFHTQFMASPSPNLKLFKMSYNDTLKCVQYALDNSLMC